MKATCSSKTVCLFALVSFLIVAAPGCKKDEEAPQPKTLCELIEGDWEVTSYRSGSEDLMNNPQIDEFIMEFEDADCEGDFDWTLTYSDGSETNTTGEYSIDEDDEEITLVVSGGLNSFTLDLKIDEEDGELEISGFVDGVSLTFKAERK